VAHRAEEEGDLLLVMRGRTWPLRVTSTISTRSRALSAAVARKRARG
jgi:hypothetical protein